MYLTEWSKIQFIMMIVYIPEVVVIKTDTENPIMLSQEQWYKVNAITCAAPNLRETPSDRMNQADGSKKAIVSDKELLKIHEKQLKRILMNKQ